MPRQVTTTITDVEERQAAVEEFIKRRKAEKEAPKKETNSYLIITRDPEGLYSVTWSGSGMLPDMLKGKFTSLYKVNQLIDGYYKDKGVPRPAESARHAQQQ